MVIRDRSAPKEDEIEITPEMIEAGSRVVQEWYEDVQSISEQVAIRVFREMTKWKADQG